MIPFLDLKAAYDELATELDEAVLRASRSGWYIGGPEVETFENAYAEYTQAKFCVGVGNGLDALILALRALDVGAGDEVIVPSHTFIATWLAVSAVGATPVPVEPPLGSFNIEVEAIKKAITPKTKVIMPVHLYGIPADIDGICKLAKEHHLYVVEDAAQAHGAKVNDKRIGAHADAVAWSFYPGKNLGALGDGGAVTTNNKDIAQRLRTLGNYGSAKKYFNEEKGVNSRLDPIQAAVLSVKLKYLDVWNARRRKIAQLYNEALAGLPFQLPSVPLWAEPVYHLYVVTTSDRDALKAYLDQEGVQTLIHYPVSPNQQGAYTELKNLSLPIATQYAKEVLSLPISPHHSEFDIERVASIVRDYFATR